MKVQILQSLGRYARDVAVVAGGAIVLLGTVAAGGFVANKVLDGGAWVKEKFFTKQQQQQTA